MERMNIYNRLPIDLNNEIIEIIMDSGKCRIERIFSYGHKSPDNFWYDQVENEWVILLKGKAKLKFDDEEILEMGTGDYINIPAHKKHKVVWTSPDEETIWLAVFYS